MKLKASNNRFEFISNALHIVVESGFETDFIGKTY